MSNQSPLAGLVRDMLALAGLTLVISGVGLFSPPLAMIVAGGMLAGGAWFWSAAKTERNDR